VRRRHASDENAIEALVPANDCAVGEFSIVHGLRLTRFAVKYWRISDIAFLGAHPVYPT
jgi:hypothetical protein